jgi:hypothetical protein
MFATSGHSAQKRGGTMMLSGQKRASPASSSPDPQPKCAKDDCCLDLSEDALGLVMEFLAPKELFRMAFTCKTLQRKLTTRLVVHSTIMHGGHASTTMQHIYELMKIKGIHAPSTLRLLRLANGKRCESCNVNKLNYVRQGYGVFLCRSCITDEFTENSESSLERIRQNPRFARIVGNSRVFASLFVSPLLDFSPAMRRGMVTWARRLEHNGELWGPILTLGDIEHIMVHAPPASVESLLGDLLPPEEDYSAFVHAYEDSQKEAIAAAQARKVKKEKSRTDAAERRTRNALHVVSKIQDLLEEPWKEFSLANTETGLMGKSPCLTFKSPLAEELMKTCVISPSKGKRTVIVEIANTMNRLLRTIHQRQLLEFLFLSQEDPLEEALKRYCLERFTDLKSVVFDPCADRQFFELMEQNQMLQAAERLTSTHTNGVVLLLWADPQLQPDFAKNVWDYEFNKCPPEVCKKCSKTFVASLLALESLKKTVEAFCIWYASRGEPHPDYDLDQARGRILRDSNLLEFLYVQDFEGLLNRMDRLVWWGRVDFINESLARDED